MTVAGAPNSAYVLDSTLADLGRISASNDYWTSEVSVELPSFSPRDLSAIIAYGSIPTLLVWIDGTGDSVQTRGGELGGDMHFTLSLYVVGVVKAGEETQRRLLYLAEDVKRVMLTNQSRQFPGSSASNTWGLMTTLRGGRMKFDIDGGENGPTVGLFTGYFDVDYRFPHAKG